MDRVSILSFCASLCAVFPLASAASITGVCPDGSIYIVQRPESIPCVDSKQVRPSEVPPLRPEMLPRPYGWEVFHRRNDPLNPYNLIDGDRTGRGEVGVPPSAGEASPPTSESASEGAQAPSHENPTPPTPAVSAAPPPPLAAPIPALGLDPREIRDLTLIVEYAQRRAPAALVRGEGSEAPSLVVRVAQSRAFEARLHDAFARAGQEARGPVVLFSAVAGRDEAFYANLTFVQGHLAFHPDTAAPAEFGIIDGHLGNLAREEVVLGYVVLPESMDLSRPMDIYWDDRQVTATLHPSNGDT